MPKLIKSTQAQKAKKAKLSNLGSKKASGAAALKTRRPKKPTWDSTSSDLTVHKLSKDEMDIRHRVHKSKNIEAAKHELYDKARGSSELNSSGNLRPSPRMTVRGELERVKKQMVLQQSLHGRELHSVLMESDRSMRVVKDLFGDDPKRYSCQPNVTVAPHVQGNRQILERAISESRVDGPPPTAHASPGGIRDKSVQDIVQRKPALNEFPEASRVLRYADDDVIPGHAHPRNPSEEEEDVGVPYKSGLDLNRFQKLVEETAPPSAPSLIRRAPQHGSQTDQRRSVPESVQSDAGSNDSVAGVSEFSSIHGDGGRGGNSTVDSDVSSVYNSYKTAEYAQGGMQSQHVAPPLRASQHGAVEISQQGASSGGGLPSQHIPLSEHPLHVSHKMLSQQTSRPLPGGGGRGCLVSGTTARTSAEKIHIDLTNLGELVGELERELSAYEKAASDPPVSVPASTSHTHSPYDHSEVTGSLLGAVQRMTQYLRQSETQLKGEVAIRGQFLQTLHEQQDLMDVLTADLLSLREENTLLRQDLADSRNKSKEEMAVLKGEMAAIRVAITELSRHRPPLRSSKVGHPSSQKSEASSTTGYMPPVASTVRISAGEVVMSSSQKAPDKVPNSSVGYSVPSRSGGHWDTGSQLPEPQLGLGGHGAPDPSLPRGQRKTVLFCSPPDLSVDSSRLVAPSDDALASPGIDGESPLPVMGQETVSNEGGVVYAQVSPLSYSARSVKSVRSGAGQLLASNATIPPRPSNANPTALQEATGPLSKTPAAVTVSDVPSAIPGSSDASHGFGSFHAPPPPPLSVALQVPTYSSALRPPLMAVPKSGVNSSQAAGTALRPPLVAMSTPGTSQSHAAFRPPPTALLTSQTGSIALRPPTKQQFSNRSAVGVPQSSNLTVVSSTKQQSSYPTIAIPQSSNDLKLVEAQFSNPTLVAPQSSNSLNNIAPQSSRGSTPAPQSSNSLTQSSNSLTQSSNDQTTLTIVCGTAVDDTHQVHSTQQLVHSTALDANNPQLTTTAEPMGSDKAAYDFTEVTGLDLTMDSTLQGDLLGDSVDKGEDLGSRVFDVAKLLHSLQQLNKTQGQLQATADKLRSLPLMTSADSASSPSSNPSASNGDIIEPGVSIKDDECSVSTAPREQVQGAGGQFGGMDLSLSGLSSSLSSLPVQQVHLHPPVEQWDGKGSSVKQDNARVLGKGLSVQDTAFGVGSSAPLDHGISPRLTSAKQTSPWNMHAAIVSPPSVRRTQDVKRASRSPSAAVVKRKVAFDISVTSTGGDHDTSIVASPSSSENTGSGMMVETSLDERRNGSGLGSVRNGSGLGGVRNGSGLGGVRNGSGVGGVRNARKQELEDKTWFSLTSHLA